ncbi:mechanosensitive ion channel family protein [Parasulfitobacter algicola]|uniref:Mechanosensitive ion channel n=1 Tax=Parasulfitobacter algicola TaxID=2614809 RepID=A0ABX2IWT0_9RHOB|nr:mechanosensitive ion channel domain-containing protein [Sulfitobacter algicola]NSX54924.1 mechanosensitive ion channel [Sulfitobacter algicola]
MASHISTGPETAEEIIQEVTSSFGPLIRFMLETSERIMTQIFSQEGIFQVSAIAFAFLAALLVTRPLGRLIERAWPLEDEDTMFLASAFRVVRRLVFPAIWAFGLWISVAAFRKAGIGNDLIRVIASLLQAWIFIRLFSTFVRDPIWSRTFATIAWIVAALTILRLLNPTIAILDSFAFNLGEARISVYMALKGIAILVMLIWLASLVSRFVQTRLGRASNMTSSVRTLIAQSVRIALLFIAIMLAMNAIGVDLTALAVFSGAVGVGIGFGLQAIFSNLVAGIILLIEETVKVGDFVELESGLSGEVREINIRATLITTNDNIDILVPNSEFINNRVTNLTLRDAFVRVRIPFGVAYGTDKDLVRTAALEASAAVPHMLTGPKAKPPQVWLVNFGDSSLDFELVVWLKPEAVKRPRAVNADYNWAIETALAKYGIEIPFPQRDLHIRSGSLPINLTAETKPSEGG